MIERIRKLREKSLRIKPYITAERAELITEFYKQNLGSTLSAPVMRGRAFQDLLQNKAVCINQA
jgi:hypothetical protein